LNIFLKELSHPYKNWRFIVTEARRYSLEYFHLLKNHPGGPEAASLLFEILFDAVEACKDKEIQDDAVDNTLLFIQKIVSEAGPHFERFQPVIDSGFDRIRKLPDNPFSLFVDSYYAINRLAGAFLNNAPESCKDFKALDLLLIKYYDYTYRYWLNEADPQTWFEKEAFEIDAKINFEDFFNAISHRQINDWKNQLDAYTNDTQIGSQEISKRLLELPGFAQIVDAYRQIPRRILQKSAKDGRGHHFKLIFLFHIMNLAGLYLIHEETLRDINLTLTWIIENENYSKIENLIRRTFKILKEQTRMYQATTLNCVLNMGKGVFNTDEIDLVNFFIDSATGRGQ
jgi:pyruvate,orthophosphate dikinase